VLVSARRDSAREFQRPYHWRELIPAREEAKLASITCCGNYVAISTIERGVMRLKALDLNGALHGEVPLPGDGAFGLFGEGYIMAILGDIVRPDGDGCTYVHSSLDRSCGIDRADFVTLSIEQLMPPAHALADRDVLSFCVDGSQGPVSYWVMRKTSTPFDGKAATIVTGYGGFNVPHIPHYSAMAAAWPELGGVWLHAQLRGGGERDGAFRQAGRMQRKQRTFDDLYAVLEDLPAVAQSQNGRRDTLGQPIAAAHFAARAGRRRPQPDYHRAVHRARHRRADCTTTSPAPRDNTAGTLRGCRDSDIGRAAVCPSMRPARVPDIQRRRRPEIIWLIRSPPT
jgi:hypothetical protein